MKKNLQTRLGGTAHLEFTDGVYRLWVEEAGETFAPASWQGLIEAMVGRSFAKELGQPWLENGCLEFEPPDQEVLTQLSRDQRELVS